jgi:3',5'-cyclic AMP phosphodiesterase CpdA
VLIVSGDVSDELPSLEEALSTLAGKFAHLFYVPGNHELWCRESDRCVRRFARAVRRACEEQCNPSLCRMA